LGNLYEPFPYSLGHDTDQREDFDDPQGSLKGIIAAAYSLGAILSLPFIPIINDKFGRRWSILGGSVVMIIGALIQGFSQHG
jgi:MFS family permease